VGIKHTKSEPSHYAIYTDNTSGFFFAQLLTAVTYSLLKSEYA